MYLCCLLPLRDILSYCYGTICPIGAESAVKPQANKQTIVDVDVVDLRAHADASMPASNNDVNYTIYYNF